MKPKDVKVQAKEELKEITRCLSVIYSNNTGRPSDVIHATVFALVAHAVAVAALYDVRVNVSHAGSEISISVDEHF